MLLPVRAGLAVVHFLLFALSATGTSPPDYDTVLLFNPQQPQHRQNATHEGVLPLRPYPHTRRFSLDDAEIRVSVFGEMLRPQRLPGRDAAVVRANKPRSLVLFLFSHPLPEQKVPSRITKKKVSTSPSIHSSLRLPSFTRNRTLFHPSFIAPAFIHT